MLKSLFAKISTPLIAKRAREDMPEFAANERCLVDVCALSADEAQTKLGANAQGLSDHEAQTRLNTFGPNEIARSGHEGFFADIFRRCLNPLAIQLLVICGVSALMADYRSAAVVGGMLVLSVALSYVQEKRSAKAVEKLRAMVQSSVVVLRGGAEKEIPMSEVVPGDIVVLHAGSLIPADLRLLSTKDFFVSQSALTGESMPVEKTADACALPGKGVMELANACFQGSNVLSGTARAVVVNTGTRTYFGSISERLSQRRPLTSFDKGIASFTWLMIRFMLVMTFAVFMIVGLSKGNWLEALLFALSVAVGLTPEMLPMIVTVNLSKGAMAMSRKKVIIKQLPSIQNFGAIDILCTDKTGTLTQDRVVLERHVDVTGQVSEDVLRYAYMNSYYQTGLRNLLDRAVLACTDLDVERNCRKVDEIPFDFQRRRMSVAIDYEGDHVLICKGAVEEIYRCCDRYQLDDEIYPLIDIIREDLTEEVQRLNRDGFRVLAIAYREFPQSKQVFGVPDETGMILLGYIAFFDPPKESAAPAISLLNKAGVQVKILTGDNPLVTRKVCADVGLDVKRLVTGDELVGLSPEKLPELAEETTVFARLSPAQKEQIIQALRSRGHVVGYMGDGINDAPSLRAADVGISVDTAVDVAKEAADIVLLEKSLLVLEEGIMEGRRVFANIIKYIRMGASSNFGNMFSVVGASYLLPFLPMRPVQILVNNLLYDFSQTGIPTDQVDEELILKPRQWNINNIKRFMLYIGPISSVFDYATFALMWWWFKCQNFMGKVPGTTADASPQYWEQMFQTGWFVESLLTQTLIVHIIRTRRVPFFGSCASPPMFFTTLAVMVFGSWLPYSPFAKTLGFVPLPSIYWLWITGFLVVYCFLTHLIKVWFIRRFGDE